MLSMRFTLCTVHRRFALRGGEISLSTSSHWRGILHCYLCYYVMTYYLILSYYNYYFNIILKESLHFHVEWALS